MANILFNNIEEFLRKTQETESEFIPFIRPRVKCADGYTVSIQASIGHYCAPRTNKTNDYTTVELGFPNKEDDLIYKFREGSDSVYGYVPIRIVNELLQKHGGIVDMIERRTEER